MNSVEIPPGQTSAEFNSRFSDLDYLDKLKLDLLSPSKVEEYQHLADTAAGALKAIETQG